MMDEKKIDLHSVRKQFQYSHAVSCLSFLIQLALLYQKAMGKTDLLFKNKSKSKTTTELCW